MYVRNLIERWNDATHTEIAEGAEWYDIARSRVAKMAQRHGVTTYQCAAVHAILSPSLSWRMTELAAEAVLVMYKQPWITRAKPPGYGANVEKALRLLDDDTVPILSYLKRETAPKTRAFYLTLVGIPSPVVDGHMANAARGVTGSIRDGKIGKREYREIEWAIEEAAVLTGMEVHKFQAVVWIVQRRLSREART